jgi:hypothetical protein
MKHLKRHGVAMMLVVVLMAAAAIMGFALLSSASMQAQANNNGSSSVSADALTQSGTNVAMYYLMYPDKASSSDLTTSNDVTYYNPGTNVPAMKLTDGSTVSKIAVSANSRSRFDVAVTSRSSVNGSTVTRTRTSRLKLSTRYVPQYAMCSNDSFTMPLTFLTSTITGPVRCDGGFGGLLTAVVGLLFGTSGNPTIPSFPKQACPQIGDLNIYKNFGSGRYTYNGGTYTANQISVGTITSATLTGANPVTNPGIVFFVNRDATMTGTINFNGTLVFANSKSLTIASNAITITAKPGYPALVVGRDLIFSGAGRKLTVNGVCWIGNSWTGSGLLPGGNFIVNGSLMWGGSGTKIDSSKLLGATSVLTVKWPTSAATIDSSTPDVVYVPELTDKDNTPKSVKIVSSATK